MANPDRGLHAGQVDRFGRETPREVLGGTRVPQAAQGVQRRRHPSWG
jgi:hypothetical protein